MTAVPRDAGHSLSGRLSGLPPTRLGLLGGRMEVRGLTKKYADVCAVDDLTGAVLEAPWRTQGVRAGTTSGAYIALHRRYTASAETSRDGPPRRDA